MTATPHLGIALLAQAQQQKEVTVNEAFYRIDALLNSGVIDRDLTTPPGSPNEGDVYIVAAGATGAWDDKDGQVAYFDQVWRFIEPQEGLLLWVNDENTHVVYDGAAWNVFGGGGGGGGSGREVLTANRTYYVRTDGSNSNTGLANNSGGAFLTIQKAVDTIAALDIAGYIVTVQVGDGTYTGATVLKNVVGFAASGNLVIQGNNSTPANVIISTTSSACFSADSIPVVWDIKDLEMRTTTSSNCLNANAATLRFSNVRFGTCAGSHITLSNKAAILALSDYAVSGNALAHINNLGISFCNIAGRTITYSNSPAFSSGGVITTDGAQTWIYGMTFTNGGTVTGGRYAAARGGTIFTNGQSTSYLPGNAAGSGTNFSASPYGLYA